MTRITTLKTSQFNKKMCWFSILAVITIGAAQSATGQVPLLQRKASLLQWYHKDFAVGNAPTGLAFDGANIWVTNNEGASVTKIRASDGVILGTFPVGTGPDSIVFDGEHMWVGNASANTVTELRASNGATLGTFAVGTNPIGLMFDGSNIWVANEFDK